MPNENSLRTKIVSKQVWKNQEIDFDPDSSPKAFEHYKKYYSIVELATTKLVKPRLIYSIVQGHTNFQLAGDCSFNFNTAKVAALTKIINNLEYVDKKDEVTKLEKALKKASDMHHTLLNFDLMPVTGGFNNLKGALKIKDSKVLVHDLGRKPISALDRFDTFIYFMDLSLRTRKEYESKLKDGRISLEDIGKFFSNSIFTISLKGENFSYLYSFLSKYDTILDYWKQFYFYFENENIEALIRELINSGKLPLDSYKRINEYIELANKFWDLKEACFRSEEKNRSLVRYGEPYHK